MSETVKQPEKSLADQRVDKILLKIEELHKEIDQIKAPTSKTETPSPKEVFDHVSIPDWEGFQKAEKSTCVNCSGNAKNIRHQIVEPYEKQNKELRAKAPWKCSTPGCEEVFSEEEAQKLPGCPKCHNTKPIKQH